MGNVGLLLTTMRKFTPKGQTKIFAALRNKIPDVNKLNKLSLSLYDDVLIKGSSPKEIIIDGLRGFYQNAEKEVNPVSMQTLYQEIEQVTSISQTSKSITAFAEAFDKRKNDLYNFVTKELGDKKLAKNIKEFTPTGNLEADSEPLCLLMNTIMQKAGTVEHAHIPMSKDFRHLQKAYSDLQECSDRALKMFKVIIPESKDPEVRKLEKLLKKQYNLNYVHLDNIEQAENVRKSLEIAKQKNIPIPQNIVVSPYHFAGGINGLNRQGTDLQTTVYIMAKPTIQEKYEILTSIPEKAKEIDMAIADTWFQRLKIFSTEKPEHMVIHEFMHSKNPLLTCNKKIPHSFKDVVENLCLYGEMSFNRANDEIKNELLVKDAIQGLNKKEKELLDFLS